MDAAQPIISTADAPRRVGFLKRALDIGAAGIGLAMLAPVFLLIAAAIKFDSAGPIFFRQKRVGRNGGIFRIVKFRTMCDAAENVGPKFTVEGDKRVTRVGAWLRRAKLDELPQLINVLAGDMSLVGPRPETPELMVYYTDEQRADMLSVRPGVTDYASILLRDEGALLARAADPARFYRETLMPLKHELCRCYLRETSLGADLKIILLTLQKLIWPGSPGAGSRLHVESSLSEKLKCLP